MTHAIAHRKAVIRGAVVLLQWRIHSLVAGNSAFSITLSELATQVAQKLSKKTAQISLLQLTQQQVLA